MKPQHLFGAILALGLTFFALAQTAQATPPPPPSNQENSGAQAAADAMGRAIMTIKAASEWKNVDIKEYNCSIPTVSANKGKCTMIIDVAGVAQNLRASPEVAAPWGFSYGPPEARPMTQLSVFVLDDEIVMIRDSQGRRISGKVDFSR